MITETGYQTNTANAYSGADQTVQAKLTLDELMDTFAAGISRVYLYELFDEGGENFGLFDANGTPKSAATAVHNLMMILSNSSHGASFTSDRLNYAVPNLAANANQMLLEKSDGTFDLILWAESAIWNSLAKTEKAAPAEATSVEFSQKQKTIIVLDPMRGTAPIASYHDVQSIQIGLADHPIIVEIPRAAGSRPASN